MRERWSWVGWFVLGAALVMAALFGAYQIPAVKNRLEWRLDAAAGIVSGWLHPGETLPTPAHASPSTAVPHTPTAVPTAGGVRVTPAPTPSPLPATALLPAPIWEKQDWNNCGPATLALGLRSFGWEGDQFDISNLLKPDRGDKNVNIEELVYFVRTRAGWLNADYRVGGTIERLKTLLAAGFPVIIEKGFVLDPNDAGGGWAGHYLLLNGYDDARGSFLTQDTNKGPDRWVSYAEMDDGWRAFNRVYLFLYRPEQQAQIDGLLGQDAEAEANRRAALGTAQAEVDRDPRDAFAWFNLGSNLIYFDRSGEAAEAFDQALQLGLPWRFTRYQFGPYIAYFNQGRFEDVIDLTTATLYRTSKSEEARLWRGWARFRLGDLGGALEDFQAALEINPNYLDAQYAVDYVRAGG